MFSRKYDLPPVPGGLDRTIHPPGQKDNNDACMALA